MRVVCAAALSLVALVSAQRAAVPGPMPAAPPQPSRVVAPRSLMRDVTSNDSVALYNQWSGVVELRFILQSGDTFYCTGTMLAPTALITSPACIPQHLRNYTSNTDWEGLTTYLGATHTVHAGDAASSQVGYMTVASYVYAPGAFGYSLAVIKVERTDGWQPDPADPTNSGGTGGVQPLDYYDWTHTEVLYDWPSWTLSYGAVGFGPNAFNELVVPIGVGEMRSSRAYISYPTDSVVNSRCNVPTSGGALVLERMFSKNAFKMCPDTGDSGAPVFFDASPTGLGGHWVVAGVLTRTDQMPCTDYRNFYTSLYFRNEWLMSKLANFTNSTVVLTPCPSNTPSPTSSPTSSASASGTGTATPSATMIFTTVQQGTKPFNWLLVLLLAIFLGGLVLTILICACRTQCRVKKWHRIAPEDKARLSEPAKNQLDSTKLKSEHEKAEEAAKAAAREGALLPQPRRMSVAQSPEALAAAEAARAARKERRRSSMIGSKSPVSEDMTSISASVQLGAALSAAAADGVRPHLGAGGAGSGAGGAGGSGSGSGSGSGNGTDGNSTATSGGSNSNGRQPPVVATEDVTSISVGPASGSSSGSGNTSSSGAGGPGGGGGAGTEVVAPPDLTPKAAAAAADGIATSPSQRRASVQGGRRVSYAQGGAAQRRRSLVAHLDRQYDQAGANVGNLMGGSRFAYHSGTGPGTGGAPSVV